MNVHPQQIDYQPDGPEPLLTPLPGQEDFPVMALGPLRPAVEAVQGMTQAPIAIPAASALAVASLAVMGHADVETLGGVRPTSLYVLTIAGSGERKSSCDAPLLAGLRSFERDSAINHRAEMQSWQNAHALWKSDRDRILAETKKPEKRTAAQADLQALGQEPTAPASADRTVTEPTFEGLTRLFHTGQPALGIFSDEGGQFLGGFAMSSENRQKTLAALNDLWQGNPIRRTRLGEGSYTLFGRRLAVHLMVQPGVAREFMSDPRGVDTGFLPRFLISEPPSTVGTRLQGLTRRDDASLAAFEERLRAVLETPLPMDPETRALSPRVLPLSSKARALLVGFADKLELAQGPGGSLAGDKGFASKAAEQAARIAGVLTLWGNLNASEITSATMAWAITLAQYYLAEAVRLLEGATVSTETRQAEDLRHWLLERWEHPEIVNSELLQYTPSRALRNGDVSRKAVARLVQAGWLTALEQGTIIRGKARKQAYRINGRDDVV